MGGAALVAVVLVTVRLSLPSVAAFLIVQDPVEEADLAVILSGSTVPRVLAARDLVTIGRVKTVLLIPEPPRPALAEKELRRLGIELPDPNALAQHIMRASGVPSSRILTLSRSIDGTINEARAVKEFSRHLQLRSVVVVTSKLSSRRQCHIFRRVFPDVQVLCHASPYDPFEVQQWWWRPRDSLHVVIEYGKLVANLGMLLIP